MKPVLPYWSSWAEKIFQCPPSCLSSQQVLSFGVTKEQVNSEIEIIKSKNLIEKTVKELGPEYFFPKPSPPETLWGYIKYYLKLVQKKGQDLLDWLLEQLSLTKKLSPYEAAVAAVEKKLDVTLIKNSNTIEIDFTWSNPVIAAGFINTLIDRYLAYRMELFQTPGALKLFQDQTKYYKKRLSELENNVKEFRKKWGISSIGSQKTTLVENISVLKKNLQETQTNISRTQKEIQELKTRIKSVTPKILMEEEVRRNPNVEFLINKLAELKLKKHNLLVKYLESSSVVENINQEISRVEEELAKEKDMIPSSIKYAGLRSELIKRSLDDKIRLATLKEEEISLLGHLAKLEEDFRTLGQKEIELIALQREVDVEDETYKLYKKKLEELRISSVMDADKIANVSVVSYASPPVIPTKPRKMLIIAIGACMGLFGGIGLALGLHYLFTPPVPYPEIESRKFYNNSNLTGFKERLTDWFNRLNSK